MPIKQFQDTSSVSIAYALSDAANSTELGPSVEMNYFPYTTEGFTMAKEMQASTAISKDRRPNGSKNTKGTATGSVGLEMGYADFIHDMLSASLMNVWTEDLTAADGTEFIYDSDNLRYFFVEKRVRGFKGAARHNYLERYYGNLINETSIEIGTSELISMTVNTMTAFADTAEADATSDEDAGGLGSSYVVPSSYEIADGANNVKNIVFRDAGGTELEVTMSAATLTIGNNVREQPAIGHEFTAGMTAGKVSAGLSGTIYFIDNTLLNIHMNNGTLSAEVEIETSEGTYMVYLPRLRAESPTANSQGENQDYTQSLTLTAERGSVALGGNDVTCVIAITHQAA